MEKLLIGENAHSFVGDHTATSIAIIFGLEHIIIVFKWLLEYLIQDVPEYVQIQLKRKEYLANKAIAKWIQANSNNDSISNKERKENENENDKERDDKDSSNNQKKTSVANSTSNSNSNSTNSGEKIYQEHSIE